MVDALDNIGRFYPNATILYVARDAKDWFRSAKAHGNLLKRWQTATVSPLVESLFVAETATATATATANSTATIPREDGSWSGDHPDAEALWAGMYERYTDLVRAFATNSTSSSHNTNATTTTFGGFVSSSSSSHNHHTTTQHSMTFLEVPLNNDTGAVLEDRVGLPKECFGHANRKSVDRNDKGIKLPNGKPKAHPRNWTVATYA